MKFDSHIGSTAAEVHVKFQRDRTILNTNLAASIETLRDLTERRLFGYWDRAQGPCLNIRKDVFPYRARLGLLALTSYRSHADTVCYRYVSLNTLRPKQNGHHFANNMHVHVHFLNENIWISIQISLKFVPRGPINNIQALVQWMVPPRRQLTHWGRATHICASVNLTIIGSENGLAPGRRQAIIWTNDEILLIGPLGTNFIEILIGIQTVSFKKMHLKLSSAKWRPFCLGHYLNR